MHSHMKLSINAAQMSFNVSNGCATVGLTLALAVAYF